MNERTGLNFTDNFIKASELNLESEPFIIATNLNGVFIVQRKYFGDIRGGFQEDFRIPDLEKIVGHEIKILQVQGSDSHPLVFRGFHFDDQEKIITPRCGHILATFVDLRKDSPSFKQILQVEFNTKIGERRSTIFLPSGVGNSFYVYPDSEEVDYTNCVTTVYDQRNSERAVGLNDQGLRKLIPGDNLILSPKDQLGLTADEFVKKYNGEL